MTDLFGNNDDPAEDEPTRQQLPERHHSADADRERRPLADRLRPRSFADFLGQDDLVGENAPLLKLIKADRIPSMMLWGPPGSGKTTLAQLIAQNANADFVTLSAVTSSVRDVRAVVDTAKVNRKFIRRTILFIDEIHRFNKAQQDAFLPHVESGIITLIGATTENPSFSVISPLLSRCRVFVLKPLTAGNVYTMLEKGLARLNADRDRGEVEVTAEPDALQAIVKLSDGDGRRALGVLEIAASVKVAAGDTTPIAHADVVRVSQRHLIYDKTGEEHYNLISALHKTLRSSDPHGALYWMGRMLAAGEEPLYVARRLVRFASEDVGLADPNALVQAMEGLRAYQALGSPEGELALAQATLYLALCPKSNSVYKAQGAVNAEIAESGSLAVPLEIRNAPTKLMKDLNYGKGYTYDHDAEGGFIPKQGLPDELVGRRFFKPTDKGFEGAAKERMEQWDKERDEKIKPRKSAGKN
ncbi:replication-associated recombination protein A [Candidatus Sumerlaeota bacterium]|nr:replication-associated recombination protein A [Candidatus Sumerlaeota bacterium]